MSLIQITTLPTKICQVCDKEFGKKYGEGLPAWNRRRYCSSQCYDKTKIGRAPWNKGIKIDRRKYPDYGHFKKHTEEALSKITRANKINAKKMPRGFHKRIQKLAIKSGRAKGSYRGTLGKTKDLSIRWKGNEAGYSSKHKWIQKYWKKTGICENCRKFMEPFGNKKYGTEWHSLEHKYDRNDKSNWVELCKKCHYIFDKKWIEQGHTI